MVQGELTTREIIQELRDQADVIGAGTECNLLRMAADRLEVLEPYHCTLDVTYIGYIYADKPNNQCKRYRLSEHYREGGKFYEDRKVMRDETYRRR